MNASWRSRQLDLFRGMAAIFMIVNHAGYKLLGSESGQGAAGMLVFLMSTAPALFFLATGAGTRMTSPSGRVRGLIDKVVLLFVADALMNLGEGRWFGLDFFGFAAIATAAMFAVHRTRRSTAVAAILLAVVLLLRFALAPLMHGVSNPALIFVTGNGGLPNVSYPLAPWLAFPLLGYLVAPVGAWSRRQEATAAGVLAVIALAATAGLVAHGAILHRWGSMSIAYFCFAIGVVASAWLLAGVLADVRKEALDGLMLRGIASLLIVPLHYAFLAAIAAGVASAWSQSAWYAVLVVLVPVVLIASRRLAQAIDARGRHLPAWFTVALLAVVAACAVGAEVGGYRLPCLLICCLGEVVVAVLLARPRRRTQDAHRGLEHRSA